MSYQKPPSLWFLTIQKLSKLMLTHHNKISIACVLTQKYGSLVFFVLVNISYVFIRLKYQDMCNQYECVERKRFHFHDYCLLMVFDCISAVCANTLNYNTGVHVKIH